jgi:hypothetical protein
MTTGTMKWFSQALLDLGTKVHNLSSDQFKLGIVNNATVPSLSTAGPHWGGTGTTNFALNQVSPLGGTQYTGPLTLVSVSWTQVSNVPTFRAAVISMTQDASGFTNGAYGIVFNNTDSNKRAIGFVELNSGSTLSLVAGPISINWGGSGTDLFTITQN